MCARTSTSISSVVLPPFAAYARPQRGQLRSDGSTVSDSTANAGRGVRSCDVVPACRPRPRSATAAPRRSLPRVPRRRSLRRSKRSFVNRRLRARRRSSPLSSSSTRDRSLAFSWPKPLTVRSNSRTAEVDPERFDSFRASPSRAGARPCNDRQWFAAQRASIPSRRSRDDSSRNAPHPPHDAPPGDCAAAPRDSTPSKRANSKPTAMPPVYS